VAPPAVGDDVGETDVICNVGATGTAATPPPPGAQAVTVTSNEMIEANLTLNFMYVVMTPF